VQGEHPQNSGGIAVGSLFSCVLGGHHENLNENRPILSAAKVQNNDCSFWQYEIYVDIRGGFFET